MPTIVQLSPTDSEFHKATHKITITAADVAAATGTDSGIVQLLPAAGSLPVGATVRFAQFQLVTPFDSSDDADIAGVGMEIGDDGAAARFLTSTELAADGTYISYYAEPVATKHPYAYATANAVDAKFTITGGASPTLAEIDSGEVVVYLHVGTSAEHMTEVRGEL